MRDLFWSRHDDVLTHFICLFTLALSWKNLLFVTLENKAAGWLAIMQTDPRLWPTTYNRREDLPILRTYRSMSIYEQKHNRFFNDMDYVFTALYVLHISTQNKSGISSLKYIIRTACCMDMQKSCHIRASLMGSCSRWYCGEVYRISLP